MKTIVLNANSLLLFVKTTHMFILSCVNEKRLNTEGTRLTEELIDS